MSKYDIIRRNRDTVKAVKSFLFGLASNIIIFVLAMTATLIISIMELREASPGDMINIMFGFFSVLIFVGGFAVISIIIFLVGTYRFHRTKRDYPNTKHESMVNFATLCLVVLLILFVTQITGGVIIKFFFENLIEIWGTIFFIIGGLAYGLYITFMIYSIYRSNLLLFIGLACSISGGILYPIFPPLLPIMGFVGSLFFFFAYFHLFIMIGHSIEDPTLDMSATKVKYKIKTKPGDKKAIKYDRDPEFDMIHKPYSAHDDSHKAYHREKKAREKEREERAKNLPKRIPKMMRFSNCPHCNGKIPTNKDFTTCPKCDGELFPT